MADDPDNLVLVYLRRIDSAVQDIRRVQSEHGERLTSLELSIGRIRRDQGGDAESLAMVNARVDRLRDDMQRVLRRLDIVDEPAG